VGQPSPFGPRLWSSSPCEAAGQKLSRTRNNGCLPGVVARCSVTAVILSPPPMCLRPLLCLRSQPFGMLFPLLKKMNLDTARISGYSQDGEKDGSPTGRRSSQ
jgi:hypothetical protein